MTTVVDYVYAQTEISTNEIFTIGANIEINDLYKKIVS